MSPPKSRPVANLTRLLRGDSLRTMRIDGFVEVLTREYRDNLDPAAVAPAEAVAEIILAERLPLAALNDDQTYSAFELTLETLWDNDRSKRAAQVARGWMKLVAMARKDESLAFTDIELLRLEVGGLRQLARAMHRAHDPLAWSTIMAAYIKLYSFLDISPVEGPHKLSALLRSEPREPVSSLYRSLLGIALPAGTRLADLPDNRTIRNRHLDDAVAYLEGSQPAYLTAADHAVVVMTIYRLIDRTDPGTDGPLVRKLAWIDARIRPQDRRGKITHDAVTSKVATYFGNADEGKVLSSSVKAACQAAGLHRHVRELAGHLG